MKGLGKELAKIAIYAVGIFLSVVALAFLGFLIPRFDWGYPDGEMRFAGLSKSEVLEKVARECPREVQNKIRISVGDGGRASNNLYFDSVALAERDGRVRNTRYMGVNFRQRFALSYYQVLEFDANGIVVSQRVARTIDGW